MKQCIICKQWKNETEFYLHSNGKLRNNCKSCHNRPLTETQKQNKNNYNRNRYNSNKDKINSTRQQYRQENKQEILVQEREYNNKNRDKILARKIEYNKKYYEQNRENILAKRRIAYNNTRYDIDRKLLNVFNKFFRNPNKNIECDLDFYGLDYKLKDVKIKFDVLLKNLNLGYSDYGTIWELDHIIPRNQFNYTSTKDRDYIICWSLNNLRPILCNDNKSRPKDGSDVSEELKQQIIKGERNHEEEDY